MAETFRKFEFYPRQERSRQRQPVPQRALGWIQRNLGLHCCAIIANDLRPQPSPVHSIATYAPVDEAQALSWCGDAELELGAAQISRAFARGDRCIGAFAGTRLVGYMWLAFGPAPHVDGIWVRYAPGDCYAYKFFVRARYRGQRIIADLHQRADALCLEAGAHRKLYMVDVHNLASVHAARRNGHLTLGYAGFLRYAGLVQCFQSRGARKAGFKLYRPR
jgi:GNAT superfamily N-acetyltransferase